MAPPGPPPYTMASINAMSSITEKKRAQAELQSYIARMKREQGDQPAHSAQPPPGGGSATYPYNGRGGPRRYHPYGRGHRAPVAAKYQHRSVVFNKPGASTASHDTEDAVAEAESKPLCRTFTSTGVCSRFGCPYTHDPNKQALCKPWLYKDNCTKGDFCPLSHTPSPNNAPTCLHFQEGRCNNEDCRFAHIGLNPAAPNCDAFGRLGWCEKGDECRERHAYECPDFANKGECKYGEKCHLRHVHRAARMRQAQSRSASNDRGKSAVQTAETSEVVDLTQDYDLTQDLTSMLSEHSTPKSLDFSGQLDFVPLDSDD